MLHIIELIGLLLLLIIIIAALLITTLGAIVTIFRAIMNDRLSKSKNSLGCASSPILAVLCILHDTCRKGANLEIGRRFCVSCYSGNNGRSAIFARLCSTPPHFGGSGTLNPAVPFQNSRISQHAEEPRYVDAGFDALEGRKSIGPAPSSNGKTVLECFRVVRSKKP